MQHLLSISLCFTLFIVTFGYSQSNQRAIQKMNDAYAKLRTENIQEGFDEIQELILYFKNNNDTLLAECYRFSGEFYVSMGNYKNAVADFTKSIEIYNEIGYEIKLSPAYSSLGNCYLALENNEKATKYYKIAQEYASKFDDDDAWARVAINLSNILIEEGDYDLAKTQLEKAYSIFEETERKEPAAIALILKSQLLTKLSQLEKASKILDDILKNELVGEDNYYILHGIYSQKAEIAALQKNYAQAINFEKMSMEQSKRGKAFNDLKISLVNISEYYEKAGNYLTALVYYKKYSSLKDSILNKQNLASINETEARFQNAIKQKEIIEKDLLIKDNDLKMEQEKNNQLILSSGALVLLILIVLTLISYRNKKKSYLKLQSLHKDLEDKSLTIEEKNREITDSIKYAEKLQKVILPDEEDLFKNIEDAFILYAPKDIIAGDFYWCKNSEDGKQKLIAVADCTGHGVPGAMVSVVCANALENAVQEIGFDDPAKILDRTREFVTNSFKKKGAEMKDGMDISLAALRSGEKSESRERSVQMHWSGANNPLWMVSAQGGFKEYRADKQPVGKYEHGKPFTNHTIQLNSGDTLYLFTDGYADQFGSEKGNDEKPLGKKFKTKNLKKLIESNSHLPLTKQKEILHQTLVDWMGNLEQVDDICIVGVKL